jgi:hypothetical protein
MKIVVCGSMIFFRQMVELKKELTLRGHSVVLPHRAEKYADGNLPLESLGESAANKIKYDLIKFYFGEISKSDAVLVLNGERHGVPNYIGGNTFLEMGFAHVLTKKIFILNPIPEMGYKDEIIAMQPTILDGDLSKID